MAEKARMTFRFDHDASRRAEGSGTAAGAAGRANGGAAQADLSSRKREESGADARSGTDDIERLERLIRETDPLPSSLPHTLPTSLAEPADKPGRAARIAVFPTGDAGSGVDGPGAIGRERADGPEGFGIEGAETHGLPGDGSPADGAAADVGSGGAAVDGPGAAADPVDAGAFGAGMDTIRNVTGAPPFFRVDRSSQRAGNEPPPSWFRVFLAVAGAIATGAAFGYLMLNLFAGQAVVPAGGPVAPDVTAPSANVGEGTLAEPAATGGIGEESGGAGTPEPAPAAAGARAEPESSADADPRAATEARPETVVIPADLFYLLQFGVFSTEESMRDAMRAAREQGLAAASVRDDGYRVFVGVAPTRDDAERLARLTGDAAVYIKVLEGHPLSLPAAGLPDDLPAFFERSGELARQLARLSVTALREEKPARIGEEAIRAVREAHAAWERTAGSLARDSGLAGEAQTLVSAAAEGLDAAFGRLEAYQERPDRSDLWDVQTAVMEALLALHRLREALQPAGSAALAGHTEPAGQA